jgi:hypothetical protein
MDGPKTGPIIGLIPKWNSRFGSRLRLPLPRCYNSLFAGFGLASPVFNRVLSPGI